MYNGYLNPCFFTFALILLQLISCDFSALLNEPNSLSEIHDTFRVINHAKKNCLFFSLPKLQLWVSSSCEDFFKY